ncbi:S-layer homology domain-containing protein [Paraclostridium sordellii]|uniref:S-layer homology domain-containing protein n=1 Tax=Paraclostridium sordellii TaxID=1505 RepID=UPI0005E0A8FF|nr:S-layer homology domain-containing protein [Paeniclostridium sordellii]CEN92922.1 glucan endo-1 [[Clostridium] sordellii] [Paeniclostridium sordellii]CEN96088.1 glucan endo-1 [[Clostridium] sordellii] [Paeniclostridium sordellii]
MKKHLISTLALGMILSTTLSVYADNKVKDIDGHWANKQISKFIENSYANGYEDNTFRPDNQITRAEFVKLVNKYFGFNDKGVSNFKDINQKNWYYNDVCIAIQAGYINGYEDNTFRPDNIITREEAAKIIVSIKNQQDNVYDKLNAFPDKHKVSNWAKPYIEGAIENGYLKGDDLKNLRPTSHITRAESVTLLSRIENNGEIKPVVEEKKDKDVKPVVDEKDKEVDDNKYPEDDRYPVYPEDNEYPEDDRYPVNPDDEYPVNPDDEYPVNPDGYPLPPFAKDKNYNGKPVIFMRDVEFHVPKYSHWDNYNLDEVLKPMAFDKNGNPLKVEYAGFVDTNIAGKFILTAMTRDSEGVYSESEVIVFVEENGGARYDAPSIEYPNKYLPLHLGDAFDYNMIGATAKDFNGNDISKSINYSGNVDTHRPGQYPVVITVNYGEFNSAYEVVIVEVM